MKRNEASWDRIARVILGIGLIVGGLTAVGGTTGTIMAAVGLVPLATGLMGWCPVYSIFKIGTSKDDASVAVVFGIAAVATATPILWVFAVAAAGFATWDLVRS